MRPATEWRSARDMSCLHQAILLLCRGFQGGTLTVPFSSLWASASEHAIDSDAAWSKFLEAPQAKMYQSPPWWAMDVSDFYF